MSRSDHIEPLLDAVQTCGLMTTRLLANWRLRGNRAVAKELLESLARERRLHRHVCSLGTTSNVVYFTLSSKPLMRRECWRRHAVASWCLASKPHRPLSIDQFRALVSPLLGAASQAWMPPAGLIAAVPLKHSDPGDKEPEPTMHEHRQVILLYPVAGDDIAGTYAKLQRLALVQSRSHSTPVHATRANLPDPTSDSADFAPLAWAIRHNLARLIVLVERASSARELQAWILRHAFIRQSSTQGESAHAVAPDVLAGQALRS